MSATLPKALEDLVAQLAKLPGLGPKSALRMAMALLQWPQAETRRLGQDITALRDNLCLCSRCGTLSSTDPCPVCADSTRNEEMLCIVADWDNILTLEDGAFYKGQYFVLGGLLAPLEQKNSQNLAIHNLYHRLQEGKIKEVILALGATVEAENTASYLKTAIAAKFPDLKISRLALGIPLGAQIKFMDKETLRQSMRYRQTF